jgi:hypothetical protein
MPQPSPRPQPGTRPDVTGTTHIATKQDMSRWVRAHADAPGINWSVEAAPGGTMLIVEHAHDRATLTPARAEAEHQAEAEAFL